MSFSLGCFFVQFGVGFSGGFFCPDAWPGTRKDQT